MAASEARYKKFSGKGKLRKNWTYTTQRRKGRYQTRRR